MIRTGLLALLGIAAFAAVYVAMGPRAPEPASAPQPAADMPLQTASIDAPPKIEDAVPFELRPGPASSIEAAESTAPATVRDVTPADMTAAPHVSGPLARAEQPKPEQQARKERLFNPIVVAAGTIKAHGHDIHLAGIKAPDFNARCGEGDAAWPCGRMARAALRRFIRGRAIECAIPVGADAIPDPATCDVAGDDIAAWLVSRGWAKVSGNAYAKEEDAARDAKRGLWGDGRPADQAEVAASG